MKLRVYTLEKTLFEGEAKEVIAKTTTGEISVLDNHIPLVTTLKPSILKAVAEDGDVAEVEIRGGFLEVRPDNSVTVLIDELN